MESHLKWPDYLILSGFLVISLSIGIYHSLTGGRQKTTSEFIMANRRLKVIPTAISMLVSFQSAIMILGYSAEVYSHGVQFIIFCNVAGVLALVFVERIVVPWIYPLKLVSVFSYLELRFMSKSIRIFGASMGIVAAILYMGVAMYAPSAALESVTGLPISVSIPVMAVVSIAYTALGGMRAVIWTDVFQFVIMIGGMAAIFIKGLITVGGITNVFRLTGEEGRLIWANFSLDPRERNTVWSLSIGLVVFWAQSYGISQASVQRFSAVETLSKARATVLLNIPPMIISQTMACLLGLIVLAFYSSIKCDPLANKDIQNPNELVPYFVVKIFADAPGFAGLFLATLYGGSLSSVSSSLSGSAANCWEDILKWKLDHLPETRKAIINRLLVVIFGTVSIGVAFLSAAFPGPIIQIALALFSSVYGPLAGFFILGAVSRHASWKGAMLGGVVGLLSTTWLSIGSLTVSKNHHPLPPVSVEQCYHGNSSYTLMNLTNYTSVEILHSYSIIDNWNQTMDVLPTFESQTIELQGLENFYSLSYLWLTPFGIIVTGVVGIIASLITRDRDLEAKVDSRLLIRIRCCSSSDKNENQEQVTDKNNASLQELKDFKEPDDAFDKDEEIMCLRKTEIKFHANENGDKKKEVGNGLAATYHPLWTSIQHN